MKLNKFLIFSLVLGFSLTSLMAMEKTLSEKERISYLEAQPPEIKKIIAGFLFEGVSKEEVKKGLESIRKLALTKEFHEIINNRQFTNFLINELKRLGIVNRDITGDTTAALLIRTRDAFDFIQSLPEEEEYKINELTIKFKKTDFLKDEFLRAVEEGSLGKIAFLLDLGVDINTKYKSLNGGTALILASRYRTSNIDVVEELIKRGANLEIQDDYKKTALFYAVASDKGDIVKLLIENNAQITPDVFVEAVRHEDIMKLFIKYFPKIDVNMKDSLGQTALMEAVRTGNLSLIGLLLGYGADINVKDNKGDTPLLLAVQHGNLNVVKLLIENGAKVNIQNYYGDTPLSIAKREDMDKIAKLLEERGAKT